MAAETTDEMGEREAEAMDERASESESAAAVGMDEQGGAGAEPAAGEQAALLALARASLIAANPEAVPELIGGATAAELHASVEAARAAYRRVAEGVRARLAGERVPAGGGSRSARSAAELADLSAGAKIAAGLRTST